VFNITADTRPRVQGETYNVQVAIAGPPDALDLQLTSDPWLPPTQIITLLLGGIPDVSNPELSASGSPQQLQEQLMQQAGTVFLTSFVSSRVGDVVQRLSTIDTVQLTFATGGSFQQFDPTARITLTEQISNRVFVTYSRTVATGSATEEELILIEYDQSDRVSWVLSRNQDQTFALDFRIRYVF
jgi:hypothetical protein